MSQDMPRAEHWKMDRRAFLANEFFEVTHAELIPFVSDEATWHDFDYLEAVELAAIIESHYGVALNETKLALPFWELLDFLDANRTHADG
jgi:hypothetical protein